jgi:hypothetical protein
MIFFKPKTIVVDCFTDDAGIHEFYPISRVNEALPDWWKKLDSLVDIAEPSGIVVARSTLKRCDGFTSLYKRGAVLPMWSDLKIVSSDLSYSFTFAKTSHTKQDAPIEFHDRWQYGETFNSQLHMKLLSPWFLKENTGCEFMLSSMTWNNHDHWTNFTILPGVVDYRYQHATHINCFLETNKEILIEAGTPMYQIIPLTDSKVVFKNHLVDSNELEKIKQRDYRSFFGGYKKLKNIKKNSSGCPFSNHT